MKLTDLIHNLTQMSCMEQDIETKGNIIDWECDHNFNFPYELKNYIPYLKEETFFNFMRDNRRGFWANKVYDNIGNVVLIQLMFNREGDDNVFNFILDSDWVIANIDWDNLSNWMDEDELQRLVYTLESSQVSTDCELSTFCEDIVKSWLDYKKEKVFE